MLLTVITITYRDPNGLKKTCDSLRPILSAGLDWEHVIVDGSPAENRSVLQTLPPSWPLKHVEDHPRGIYAAMNTGIQTAQGRLVWLLNGGDALKDASLLMRLLGSFEKNTDLDLVCAGVDLYRDGVYLYPRPPGKTFLRSILGANGLCQQGLIYKRLFLNEVGPFSESYKTAADYEYHFRCYSKGVRVLCIRESLVNYDVSGASAQVESALKEIWRVHQAIWKSDLPFALKICDIFGALLEDLRVKTVKWIARSPLAPRLRGIWIRWHRSRNSVN
jgi:glycosyltransferase involved in cell wall biosynthesis